MLSTTHELPPRRQMSVRSWTSGTFNALMHTVYSMQLPFCVSREINHFYFELPDVLHLSCEETLTYETGILISTTILLLIPFSVILVSYTLILVMVIQITSAESQKKKKKSILNLLISPDSGQLLLWCHHFHVYVANLLPYFRPRIKLCLYSIPFWHPCSTPWFIVFEIKMWWEPRKKFYGSGHYILKCDIKAQWIFIIEYKYCLYYMTHFGLSDNNHISVCEMKCWIQLLNIK